MSRSFAICIATCGRPELLERCLRGVLAQVVPWSWSIEVRVVDNDAAGTSRAVVERMRAQLPVDWALRWQVEPVRSIARARNAALAMGGADFFAFIDDDETPDPNWLLELSAILERSRCAAVVGAVDPELPTDAPRWAERGRFFHKVVDAGFAGDFWQAARTSNAMLCGAFVERHRLRFREAFGRSGGEDSDLFRRLVALGGVLSWAPRARVVECILPEQCRLAWLMRRHLRGGRTYQRLSGAGGPLGRGIGLFRSFLLCLVALPAAALGRPEPVVRALLGVAVSYGRLVERLVPSDGSRAEPYPSAGMHRLRSESC